MVLCICVRCETTQSQMGFLWFFFHRSFFELLLFFGKEEFVEDPLKDIIDCFQVTELTNGHISLNLIGVDHQLLILSLKALWWIYIFFLMYYFWFFSAGVSHSAPETPKQLSSSSKAHHQIRRTMGESSTAKNPEGGRPSTKWRWVYDLWCNYCTLWEVNPKSNVWASKPMFSVVMSYIECTYF